MTARFQEYLASIGTTCMQNWVPHRTLDRLPIVKKKAPRNFRVLSIDILHPTCTG